MEKLVIDRVKWLRGEGDFYSYLKRTADGKMCCLGFYCLSKGFDELDILGGRGPQHLTHDLDKVSSLVEIVGNRPVSVSQICAKLMRANDAKDTSEKEREIEVARLFRTIDVEVEFIN